MVLVNDFVLNVYNNPLNTYTSHCGKDASRDLGEVILLNLREKETALSDREKIRLRASFGTLVHRSHGAWKDQSFLIVDTPDDVDDLDAADTSAQHGDATVRIDDEELRMSISDLLEAVEDPFLGAEEDANVSRIWDDMIAED
jgi:hypothetical protein